MRLAYDAMIAKLSNRADRIVRRLDRRIDAAAARAADRAIRAQQLSRLLPQGQ